MKQLQKQPLGPPVILCTACCHLLGVGGVECVGVGVGVHLHPHSCAPPHLAPVKVAPKALELSTHASNVAAGGEGSKKQWGEGSIG